MVFPLWRLFYEENEQAIQSATLRCNDILISETEMKLKTHNILFFSENC